jgi:hypothetical protein
VPSLADSSFTRARNVRLECVVGLGLTDTLVLLATIFATLLRKAFVFSCGWQPLNCPTALTSLAGLSSRAPFPSNL